jgi:putative SOS response-associated peptidase YedK
MCYNVSYREPDAQKLHSRYADLLPPSILPLDLPTYYFVSGFDHPALPIVNYKGIEMNEWGLIPHWVKDGEAAKKMRPITLNAQGETVFEKPAYRDSILKQRCLIPVNGFIEWQDVNKVKYPYYISVKSNNLFSIGGIYSHWTDKGTGEIRTTFSVITTAANPLLEKIHNLKKRMPLIIARRDESKWIDRNLSKEEIQALIKPYDENDMKSYTISRHVNNPRNDRNIPEILNEVKYPELNEATLF